MKYYIADLHFFHSGLNEKMDERGFASVEEMNSHMIKKWNGRVRANDDVIVLGDFSFGTAVQTNELMDQLNGRLFLITGNHDRFLSYRQFDMNRFGWVCPYTEIYN
jgi:calcineurin-like phosphoesterase family protein